MNDIELVAAIRDMTNPGIPVTLHTIKAGVLTADKSRVEPFVKEMVKQGELVALPKGKYQSVKKFEV